MQHWRFWKDDMKRYLSVAMIAAATAVAASAAVGQEAGPGAEEFRLNCAACHGLKGRGDGPVAQDLSTPPKDLTRLAADNGGVFPFERVYRVIDGRRPVAGHGTEDMPIWGRRYTTEAITGLGPYYYPLEDIVQSRILSLVYFIDSIQAPPE